MCLKNIWLTIKFHLLGILKVKKYFVIYEIINSVTNFTFFIIIEVVGFY